MNTVTYKEFNRQLEQALSQSIFRDLIVSNELLRNDFFSKFINTKKEPSSHLFAQQYISDEEWVQAHQDSHSEDPAVRKKGVVIEKKMGEVQREFYRLNSEGAVDQVFYDYTIKATDIFKTLFEIERKFMLLQKSVINNHVSSDYSKSGEVFASNIFTLLKMFTNPLWIEKLSKVMLDTQVNIFIDIQNWFNPVSSQEEEAYQVLKEHFDYYLSKYLSQEIDHKEPDKGSGKKPIKRIFNSFEELFHSMEDMKTCVNALRNIDTPVINDADIWIGKKRGKSSSISIVVAWIEVLEIRNKIDICSNRRLLTDLLNVYFPGLDMSPGMFDKNNNIQNEYKTVFLAMIER